MRLLLSALLSLSLTACVDDATLGDESGELVNGLVDLGHEPVVRVAPLSGFEPCTGTLIGERTVVTAGHCVHDVAVLRPQMQAELPVRACPTCAPVLTWITGTPISNPNYNPSNSTGVDLALIHLDQAVPYVKMSRVPGLAKILVLIDGSPITLVGFGQPDFNTPQFDVKRWGSNTVDSHDNTYFYFSWGGLASGEATTCYGDSGGPAYTGDYDADCILGVTKGISSGSPCQTGAVYRHTRLDRTDVANWILTVSADPTISTCIPYRK